MTKEDAKFYEENLRPTITLYFKKEINLNVFVLNEKLRNNLNYFFTTVLRQTNINFACSDCISTAIRHSNAMFENYKLHQKNIDMTNNLAINRLIDEEEETNKIEAETEVKTEIKKKVGRPKKNKNS